MDVLKSAKSHFKERLGEELKCLTVPEWNKCIAWGMIFRCRDENGKPLFNRGHLDQIIDEFDPDVCQRIIEEMNANDPTQDEIKGN
jgi:hypothetical protein